MRRALYLVTAAAIAVAAVSTPALAGDNLQYDGDSMLAASAKGKPYWMIQAQCSGFFGATSVHMSEKGDTAAADQAKTQGVAFFRDAVDRLVKDRGLARAAAIDAVSQAVDAGREEGFQKIRDGGGVEPRSHWNVARSVCMDINDAYKSLSKR